MATIWFVDGFDHCDYNGSKRKYQDLSNFDQGFIVDGRQPPSSPGGGRALFLMNSAFGYILRTRLLPAAAPRVVLGFAYQPGGGGWGDAIILRLESAASIAGANANSELSVRQDSAGIFRFYTGGQGTDGNPGSEIAALSTPFAPGVWKYVEIDVTFGTFGVLKVFVDDVQVYSATSLAIGAANPDRLSLRQDSFGGVGPTFDDLYVADDRLGPCRVTTTFPAAAGQAQWTTRAGAATNWQAVGEKPPSSSPVSDGDTSYIEADSGSGVLDLFPHTVMACYGRVLAVAVNAVGRDPLAANLPAVQFYVRPRPFDPSDVAIGSPQLWSGATFQTVQAILQTNPATGLVWLDRELSNAWWGLAPAGTGRSRVTQFYLEKLVTLRAVTYGCGQGSYTYGH